MPDKFQPQQEGSRWRYARPTSDEFASWFKTVPLDADMHHADFVAGLVLIPASEKVKYQVEGGTRERYEMTYTPYVRVDTRIAYFRKLAAANKQIAVIEPVPVPRITGAASAAYNAHMPEGYWWHIVKTGDEEARFLCCTMRVALYREEDWWAQEADSNVAKAPQLKPVLFGVSTKQIKGPADENGLAKAETGAIGRALGVAGILVVGTGIATAEDMQEATGTTTLQGSELALPAGGAPELSSEAVNERLIDLQNQMKAKAPDAWREFSAWWAERKQAEGWSTLEDAPVEARRGMVTRMESMLTSSVASSETAAPDSSPDAPVPVDGGAA